MSKSPVHSTMRIKTSRACLVCALLTFSLGQGLPVAFAQAAMPAEGKVSAAVSLPFYSGAQAMQALYGQHLPPRAQSFSQAAQQLITATQAHCTAKLALPVLRTQWQATLVQWQALATPALGPVLTRRSQRLIDFWPSRPALLEKAIAQAPQKLADLERIGTPAKGFPALDWLLQKSMSPEQCSYAQLLAQEIAQEAAALEQEFAAQAQRDWAAAPEQSSAAHAEWINQWLAGLERLRWQHIEQALQKAASAGPRSNPAFARVQLADNLADWRAQWQALRVQARMLPEQYSKPPQAGQDLLTIEALLLSRGRLALAQRWVKALNSVDLALQTLPAQAQPREMLALAGHLKALGALYQNEVATALDVALGFSDADGD